MIEVGLIGFGLAGRCFHAPVIRAVAGLRLAAVVQRSADTAAQLFPGVSVVRTIEELLAIGSIRLIVIATPNQTHFPLAKRCLEAGRDVVVDKPFTTTLEEAVELFRLARERGRLLTVYHNRRFDADFQGLRGVIAAGDLGRIVRFESHYDRYRPAPKPGAWREQPGPGSGVLFDLAPHLIDHALTLFGAPQALTADVRIEREGMATDDAFDIVLHYAGSLRAQLCASMLSATPRPRFLVMGEKGSYLKRDFDPLETALRNGFVPQGDSWVLDKPDVWGELTVVRGEDRETRRVPSKGDWRQFYANVRDVLLGKALPEVTAQQALDVMAALELAQESSARKCTVAWRHAEWS